jgi:hypothetical protein
MKNMENTYMLTLPFGRVLVVLKASSKMFALECLEGAA